MTLTDVRKIPARIQITITIHMRIQMGCFMVHAVQEYHMHAN